MTAGGGSFKRLPNRPTPEFSVPRESRHPQRPKGVWKPVSDRKIRVGIVGYGVCQFGAEFGFQDHPNVEIVAVSDLLPDRCAGLAKACRCAKTYPSLEELVKDDTIEAVFVATDAPSHAKHCIDGAGARQARGLGGAGRVRLAGGCRQALGGG